MKIGIVIQARTGSTRLPNKMLMPFYEGKGVFQLLIEKLLDANFGIQIVLATTTSENDSALVQIAENLGINVYRGSENDVLMRFIEASEQYGIDKIIRICADNPFLDIQSLKNLIDQFNRADADYKAFQTGSGVPTIKTHYGFWAEGVTLKALKKVDFLTKEEYYHEHVTNYIYENEEIFKCDFIKIHSGTENSEIRMTLDTKEDFGMLKDVYHKFVSKSDKNLMSLVKFVENNKEWMSVMSAQIDENSK